MKVPWPLPVLLLEGGLAAVDRKERSAAAPPVLMGVALEVALQPRTDCRNRRGVEVEARRKASHWAHEVADLHEHWLFLSSAWQSLKAS